MYQNNVVSWEGRLERNEEKGKMDLGEITGKLKKAYRSLQMNLERRFFPTKWRRRLQRPKCGERMKFSRTMLGGV